MVWGGDFTTDDMIENCLSNVGGKAAVQIAGEGSTVIINGGEFWGCGGADVIGITGLNGGSVKEYTLRINAGTFDTSKTDKERLPDRCAGVVNSGPWPWSHSNWMLWANCRCIRDTLRGDIGIPAVDGYGKNVFNTKMVHVYIDDEEPEDECIDNADLDFRCKSDSDTIIVKPREEKSYWNTEAPIWGNYAGRNNYAIYAYSDGEIVAQAPGSDVMNHGPAESPTFFFSAVSHYDMTDEDNPYFDRAHRAIGNWVLYEEDKNGNLINSFERVSAPFKTEHEDGHTIFNFKIPLSYFPRYSGVKWDETHKYYLVAYMEERFGSNVNTYVTQSYTTSVFQDWEKGIYVVAAPEPEVHTCDYEGYAQNDEKTHFRVCSCGEKIGEVHSFTQQIIQEVTSTNAVLGMTCSCGYYYEAEVEDSMLVHSHTLEYVYDLQSHWQICADEDCPDAYISAHQAHSFELCYTDDSGKECYGCTVCGTAKLDDQVSVQIVTQPKNVTVLEGATASVRVVASGDGLTYKWYYKSKGESAFSLTTAFKSNFYSVQMNASRAGWQVCCVITDKYGSVVQTVTVTLNMN